MSAQTPTVDRVADLSDSDREDLRALSVAVYPPEEAADWPGRSLEWPAAEWCVRVRREDGPLVSYESVSLREARHDPRAARVRGIGGVKRHPAARRRGVASRGMPRAIEFFHEQPGVAFARLVCGPHLLDHYSRIGWREFAGRLLVRTIRHEGRRAA